MKSSDANEFKDQVYSSEEDDNSPRYEEMLDSQIPEYDRANWIKACYQHKMKRIHNPPNNYE